MIILIGYHLGDFIEFFGEDAKIMKEIAGITLSRTLPRHGSVLIGGFPAHAILTYEAMIEDAGYELAIEEDRPEFLEA